MSLQQLRILLVMVARHAYDDVVGLADRLSNVRGYSVDTLPRFQCADTLNDPGIRKVTESMDESLRRKQTHLMATVFQINRNGLCDVAGSKNSNFFQGGISFLVSVGGLISEVGGSADWPAFLGAHDKRDQIL